MTATASNLPPGLHLVGRRFNPRDFLVIALDPDTNTEVRVRVDLAKTTSRYRCDACGPMPTPNCKHTLIASKLTRRSTTR